MLPCSPQSIHVAPESSCAWATLGVKGAERGLLAPGPMSCSWLGTKQNADWKRSLRCRQLTLMHCLTAGFLAAYGLKSAAGNDVKQMLQAPHLLVQEFTFWPPVLDFSIRG